MTNIADRPDIIEALQPQRCNTSRAESFSKEVSLSLNRGSPNPLGIKGVNTARIFLRFRCL